MIISVNWLKKFINIDIPVRDLATLIGARLVEIEDIIDLGEKYKDVIVAKVISAEKIEDSDHLNLVMIDDGGVVADIERDDNGYIQVVCGAPNVRAELLVAWLPPKSIVPETYGAKEPFVLEARKLRGFTSNGMIASARELDLFDEHDGIVEIDKDAKPGTRFAKLYELDDYLFDIENKSLTHRPDTFGVIGFAREVAAILGQRFETPDWLLELQPKISSEKSEIEPIEVTIDDFELSSRYQVIVLDSIAKDAKTPFDIQTYLARSGVRPISPVVDVTNYMMLLTGQPLHAFDYDKLVIASGGAPEIHVRSGVEGETLELLDGRIVDLHEQDIVIASRETPIALAGAMGGKSTAIDDDTRRIVLESATFDLYRLRTTQMRHGIFSEAITRFTKGQPPELTAPVLASAVYLLNTWAGAKPITPVSEQNTNKEPNQEIGVSVDDINLLLGTSFTAKQVQSVLENNNFDVSIYPDSLRVTAPYWRTDINIKEDIIEEIGRLTGFDAIYPTLPSRYSIAVGLSGFDDMRQRIRQILVSAGANEVLTYSFVHGNILRKAGQDTSQSYRLVNSISPELQYYRQSVTPSLLTLVHPNIKQGYNKFALFEMNKAHYKGDGLDGGVPVERQTLGFVVACKHSHSESWYYQAKHTLDYLLRRLHVQATYEPLTSDDMHDPIFAPFEPKRSAKVIVNGVAVGVVGEYRGFVKKEFKLPASQAGFELDTDKLFEHIQSFSNQEVYKPSSKYPSVERDICFKVDTDKSYQAIFDSATEALQISGLEYKIDPVDIFSDNDETKNITIRIRLTSHDKTLTSGEVAKVVDGVVDSVGRRTKGVVV
jgi:phenylalanyl-tRNA synthetase beta chain